MKAEEGVGGLTKKNERKVITPLVKKTKNSLAKKSYEGRGGTIEGLIGGLRDGSSALLPTE